MSIEIDCNFPGGNIVVEDVKGNLVRMRQDLRDTQTAWFYWHCRVRGAAGRNLKFVMTGSKAIGSRGPAVSLDEGLTWRWLGAEAVSEQTFQYSFSNDAEAVRFSYGMPYQEAHWRAFIDSLVAKAPIARKRLAITRKGREAEYVALGAANPKLRMALTCRHHACEMTASYVLEGLARRVAESDEEEAKWFRDNVEMLIVPFVDKDGVEDGDQGKNRKPRDHNRDYIGDSVHVETAAIRELLPAWSEGRLLIAVDLHNPHISGPKNEDIYLVGMEDAALAAEQRRFSEILEKRIKGSLLFRASDYLAFGTGWNTKDNFQGGLSFSRWAGGLAGIKLATSIEIPYASALGAEVNQKSAREFGHDLASAFFAYVRAG